MGNNELKEMFGFKVEGADSINYQIISKQANYDLEEFLEIYFHGSASLRNAIVLYKNKLLRNRSVSELSSFKKQLNKALAANNENEVENVLKEMFLTNFINPSNLSRLKTLFESNLLNAMFEYYKENRTNLTMLLKRVKYYN